MSLNIKNERTHALVRRLADLTGQSQTAAVEDAVVRRLADVEASTAAAAVDQQWADVAGFLVEFRAGLTADERARMLGADDELYDERGLPR